MGHRCRPSREEGGPAAPGDQWWRHLLIKETRNDPARRATPCPSRYQTFRSLLIGFINRFGGVSVVTEGSFRAHDFWGAGHAVYGVIARARPFGTCAAERRGQKRSCWRSAHILTSLKCKRNYPATFGGASRPVNLEFGEIWFRSLLVSTRGSGDACQWPDFLRCLLPEASLAREASTLSLATCLPGFRVWY